MNREFVLNVVEEERLQRVDAVGIEPRVVPGGSVASGADEVRRISIREGAIPQGELGFKSGLKRGEDGGVGNREIAGPKKTSKINKLPDIGKEGMVPLGGIREIGVHVIVFGEGGVVMSSEARGQRTLPSKLRKEQQITVCFT